MDPSDDTSDTALDDRPAAGDDEQRTAPARRRRLDGRTLGICVCVALVGAILAALVASAVIGDDDAGAEQTGDDTKVSITEVADVEELLAVELLTPTGEPTSLEAVRMITGDKPLVINLWAQSCVPCVDEMPLLEAAHQANPDLAFLGVDTVDQQEKAAAMVEKTGITYSWLQDPAGDFAHAAKIPNIPGTFILMPSGEIVASKIGAFDSQGELQQWLDDHVA